MRSKLAGLVGILALALAFGLGAAAQHGATGQPVVADGGGMARVTVGG
ncbi:MULTISPECIES: hypothetical protein [Streptomyces]|nr:hypothetical protein [Streptomyces sp. CB01201]MBX7467824.1 hypothetical protein [Streptomyces sp. MAG02]